MKQIAFNIGDVFQSPWGRGSGGEAKGFAWFVSVVLSNAVVIAGIILLFLLLGGGIAIIAGTGQNNPEATAKGKQAVTAAVIGFIIVFAAYWIIILVEQITGLNILMPVEP